jgi:hypothetical protein
MLKYYAGIYMTTDTHIIHHVLALRTKQVIKVMRDKDKGGKKIGSNKYK